MKIRRFTYVLDMERAKQVVPIDLLLPGDASVCLGVQALICGNLPSTRRIIPNFGEYSLELNGKTKHPFHGVVSYVNQNLLTEENYHRPDFYPLDVELTNNKLVTGYYRDLNEQSTERFDQFIPYQIKFQFLLKLS